MSGLRFIFMRLLFCCMLVSLSVFLIGCGSSDTPQGSTSSKAASTPQTTSSTPSSNTTPVPAITPVDSYGVHFASTYGLVCETSQSIVLASTQRTFNSSDIAAMSLYLGAYERADWATRMTSPAPTPPLAAVPVSNITSNPERCFLRVDVKNNSSDTITLNSADVQVAHVTTHAENNQYDLVDGCSMFSCIPPNSNDVTMTCRGLFALIAFNYQDKTLAHEGQVQSSPFLMSQNCGLSLTVAPSQSQSLFINVSFAWSPGDYSYTLVPEISMKVGNAQQKVTLPSMTATKTFTDSRHFVCYGLNGQNTFVPEDQNGHAQGVIKHNNKGLDTDCL